MQNLLRIEKMRNICENKNFISAVRRFLQGAFCNRKPATSHLSFTSPIILLKLRYVPILFFFRILFWNVRTFQNLQSCAGDHFFASNGAHLNDFWGDVWMRTQNAVTSMGAINFRHQLSCKSLYLCRNHYLCIQYISAHWLIHSDIIAKENFRLIHPHKSAILIIG